MKLIKLSSIQIKERVRHIDQAHVRSLADSIEAQGLLQPIVVHRTDVAKPRLIAGEHRLEAFKLLGKESIPANSLVDSLREQGVIDESQKLSESELLAYEIEENVKRLSLTWQDRVKAVARYHNLHSMKAAKNHERWYKDQTADLLGMTRPYVGRFITLASVISENPTGDIASAVSITEAFRLLLKEKQQEASGKLKSLLSIKKELKKEKDVSIVKSLVEKAEEDEEPELGTSSKLSKDYIDSLWIEGDCLKVMPTLKKVDHIISDPVYGIEMNNLLESSTVHKTGIKSLDSVREEHVIEDNLELLQKFLPACREVIKETGFMIMFYDLEHHEKLQTWARDSGWFPCRWPFHWCKQNKVNRKPEYNMSKTVEHAMVLRASSKSYLPNPIYTNWIHVPSETADHPFYKPFKLWKHLIEAVSFPGQTILDPMAGQGSCLDACLKLGRNPQGIEIKNLHVVEGRKSFLKTYNYDEYKKHYEQ